MKNKILKITITVLGILILIFGVFFIRRAITPITYSNLSDEDTLGEVMGALEKSGLSKESIEIFQSQVEFTNEYLKDLPNLQGKFTTKKGTVVAYDENLAFNLFVAVKLPEDLNCRIAAWNLVKYNIEAVPIKEDIEYAEQNILDFYPYTGFSDGDKEKYWSVFKGIPSGRFHTKKGYEKIIQEEWEKRGVKFTTADVKLISCFSYSSENKWLEAVHTGVMIPDENGILFIEKWNPKAPFQVSKFKNEKQLKYYLQQRLMRAFILNPVIMKNNELL